MTEPGAVPPPSPAAGDTADGCSPAAAEGAAMPLTGMTVVVTGAMTGPLEQLSRNQMNQLIERAGGRPPPPVTPR